MNETQKNIQRIIKETGKANAIPELYIIDTDIGKITPAITGMLEKCKKIDTLSLSSCKLESIQGLPNFDKLVSLDLSENLLTDKEVEHLAKYKGLSQLFLEKNNISKVEAFEPLKGLAHLERIELIDNPVTKVQNYRQKILDMFPKLLYLDSKDRNGVDLPEEEEGDDESEYEKDESEEDSEYEEDEEDSEEDKRKKKRKTK